MESRKRQFVVKAVPCFSDVSGVDFKFLNMPNDATLKVRQACIEALKRIGRLGTTDLCCTLDNSDVKVDVVSASTESSRFRPIFASLM